jgi:hypothetical protein
MRAVVDASVIVKWLLPATTREPDTPSALAVLDAITVGALEPLQPPHWLCEVTAVGASLPRPRRERVQLLHAMELPAGRAAASTRRARWPRVSTITSSTPLYHAATRCEPDMVCITADEVYYRKARGVGGLVLLRDYEAPRHPLTLVHADWAKRVPGAGGSSGGPAKHCTMVIQSVATGPRTRRPCRRRSVPWDDLTEVDGAARRGSPSRPRSTPTRRPTVLVRRTCGTGVPVARPRFM